MIAGYETTSTALAYATYVLATVDGIQQKLVDEIDRTNWETMTRDEFYDRAANLAYLDLFVREVLRMYPITSKGMTRECNTTTNVYGHTIEKGSLRPAFVALTRESFPLGSVIQPDVFTVHYNADLWGPQDPYLFDPERHTVKRHAVAWMPFGIGPRNCVGMRFALMELKMCLIHLLRQYRLLPGEKIEEGFQRQEKLVIQPNAIYVKLEPRSG